MLVHSCALAFHDASLYIPRRDWNKKKNPSLKANEWNWIIWVSHASSWCGWLRETGSLAWIAISLRCTFRVRVCVCVWVCVCFSVRFLSSFNFGSGPRISSAFLLAGPITKVPMATRNTCRRGVGGGGGGGGGACLRTAPPSWPQPAPPIFRFRLAVLPDFRTRLFFFAGIGGLDAPPRGRHGTRHSKLGKTR